MSSRMLNKTDAVEWTFPESRNFILKKGGFFQELNNLIVNKPFINFRQNRQYRALVNYRDCSCALGIWKLACDHKRWLDAENSCVALVSSDSEVRNNHSFSKIELTKPRFKYMGLVVRRPIGANPGLNFNLRFFFFSSKAFFSDTILYCL